jgi:hypothetical protein
MEHEGSLPCSQQPSTGPYQINPVQLTTSYLRFILILSSDLFLGLPSCLFPSGFLTNILHALLRVATCPAHLILVDYIILIILGEEVYMLWCSSLCSFLQPPATTTLLGPNILPNTLFSNTLSLCSSLNLRDQVSHPYRTTGKIIVLYIVIFTLLDSRREDKWFWTEQWQALPEFNLPLILFLNY